MCVLRSITKVQGGAREEGIEWQTHGEAPGGHSLDLETTDGGETREEESEGSERETTSLKVMEAWYASTVDARCRSLTNLAGFIPFNCWVRKVMCWHPGRHLSGRLVEIKPSLRPPLKSGRSTVGHFGIYPGLESPAPGPLHRAIMELGLTRTPL
ncbi:hypothetical protein PG996_011412 [Apiospora saccharicola]|uniref:Uncharacterized protein n=1 Tax=Apiospora saccharicola TaxID=335842 RepID=A0ABR1UEZ0_9PEZI